MGLPEGKKKVTFISRQMATVKTSGGKPMLTEKVQTIGTKIKPTTTLLMILVRITPKIINKA